LFASIAASDGRSKSRCGSTRRGDQGSGLIAEKRRAGYAPALRGSTQQSAAL
jgi:hypothetical protein